MGILCDEGITKSSVDLDIVELNFDIILVERVNIGANDIAGRVIKGDDLGTMCYRERATGFVEHDDHRGNRAELRTLRLEHPSQSPRKRLCRPVPHFGH